MDVRIGDPFSRFRTEPRPTRTGKGAPVNFINNWRRRRRFSSSHSNSSQARRGLEALEPRVLFAQTIDTPDSPITQIAIEDTGEFQFKSTQVFEQNAGTGQIYQFDGSKPLSSIFLRTEDGTVYGNSSVVFSAIPFTPVGSQTRTTGGGTEVITSTFAPSDGAPFTITQTVEYTPGNVFFFVENSVQNTGNSQLVFSFFAYADPNPRGRSLYDPDLGAIASIDSAGQPTVVIDPLDSTSTTAAEFHEGGFYSDVTSKIGTVGGTLAFSPQDPQPPDLTEQDTGIALQWAFDFIDPGASALYAFTVGNDPVGGNNNPPPSGDAERPFAKFDALTAPDPNTRTIGVTYRDTAGDNPTGVDSGTIDLNDIFLTGPGITDDNRFPTNVAIDTDSGGTVAVTYTFTRSGGGFTAGVYDINLVPGGVSDFAGNAATADANAGTDPNKIGFFEAGPPRLSVTRETNSDVLRQKLLGDSTGLTITNFVVRGQQDADGDVSTGTYVNPGGLYGLAPGGGIVISNGDAGDYSAGPNLDNSGADYGVAADAGQESLLDQLTPASAPNPIDYNDVTQIDITFDLAPDISNIFFDVVYGTEEYPEFTSPNDFPDAFGLFLNGVNIAKTPTLNPNDGNTFEPINAANSNIAQISGTELDGVLAVGGNPVNTFSNLGAPGGSVPLQRTGNTLTLIIADAVDGAVASTAFISALGVRQSTPVDTSNIATNLDINAIAQQSGKILVGGSTQAATPAPALQRYANGVLDAAFGSGGSAPSLGIGSGAIQAILIQPDGKILVAGGGGAAGDLFVGRFTAEGQIDSSFGGGDGLATLDVGSNNDVAFGIALDGNGRIVVAGSTDTFSGGKAGSNFVVARFTPTGTLDAGFSGGDSTVGYDVAIFDPGDVNRAGSVAITSGNGVVVAGQTGSLAAVAKYNENGSLDTGFDADGKRILNEIKTTDPIVGLAVQGDGKILVAGADAAGVDGQLNGSNFLLARLTTQGALDTSFGTGGITRTDMGGTEDADTILLGSAGIYVLGTRATDKAGDANNVIVNTSVALYNSNGGNTSTLGPNGYVFFDPIIFQVAGTPPADNPAAIGNPFQQLIRSAGSVDQNGNVVASKPNVTGAGSNIIQVVQAAPDNPGTPVPPNAALPAGLQVTAAQADFSFTVEYSDDNGVDVSDVGTDDLVVSRGGTALVVKSAVVNNGTDGSPRSVTYTVGPADGSFDRFDNGTYVVHLGANQISDINELAAAEADLGSFTVSIPAPTGTGFGGKTKATITDPGSGTPVTFSVTNGTAMAFVENGRITLELNNVNNAAFTIKAKGAVTLGNVVVNGSLKSFNGKTANLSGVMAVTGSLGKTTLSNISGGTITSGGTIAGITVNSITNGKILAGTTLGSDLAFGGGDDNFAGAGITKISVKGAVTGASVFAAGVNPGAGFVFGDGNDTGVGSGRIIKAIAIKGAVDSTTRFEAAAFPKATKFGREKVTPLTDPRFVVV